MSASSRPDSIPGLDIVSHDVYEQGVPFTAYDRFRREAPVAWINEGTHNGHPGAGFWSLTRWHDVVAVHKDWRTFSSEVGGTELEELAADALVARRTMLETDPPRHTRLRQLVNPAFAKSTVDGYADTARRVIRDLVDESADRLIGVGEFDVVDAFARELPIRMLVEILGVPLADAPQLFHWTDQIVYHADPDFSAAVIDRTDTDRYRLLPFRSPVALQVFEYVERLAAIRRADPAADVITVLADAVIDDQPLSERERGTFLLLLLIAGNETTRHSLTQAVIAFARHPEQFARLQRGVDDPAVVDAAVEEVLRWACPQVHFRRTATVDTELGGQRIAAGDKVVTWYPAANTDPDVFPDPHRFDIARSPNRHVTFGGGGPHLCLGQWMARLEVRVFVEALARRVGSIEITGPVRRVRSNFINGIKSCPVAMTGVRA
jgi:cytochrome P450